MEVRGDKLRETDCGTLSLGGKLWSLELAEGCETVGVWGNL